MAEVNNNQRPVPPASDVGTDPARTPPVKADDISYSVTFTDVTLAGDVVVNSGFTPKPLSLGLFNGNVSIPFTTPRGQRLGKLFFGWAPKLDVKTYEGQDPSKFTITGNAGFSPYTLLVQDRRLGSVDIDANIEVSGTAESDPDLKDDKPAASSWTLQAGLDMFADLDGDTKDVVNRLLSFKLGLNGISGFQIDAGFNIPINNTYLQFAGKYNSSRSDGKFYFTGLGSSDQAVREKTRQDMSHNLATDFAAIFNTRRDRGQLVLRHPALLLGGGISAAWDAGEDVGDKAADGFNPYGLFTLYFPKAGGEWLRDIAVNRSSAFFIGAKFSYSQQNYAGPWFMPNQCDETNFDSCRFYDDQPAGDTPPAGAIMQDEGEDSDPEYVALRRPYSVREGSIDFTLGVDVLDLVKMKGKFKDLDWAIVPSVGFGLSGPMDGSAPWKAKVSGGINFVFKTEGTLGKHRSKAEAGKTGE